MKVDGLHQNFWWGFGKLINQFQSQHLVSLSLPNFFDSYMLSMIDRDQSWTSRWKRLIWVSLSKTIGYVSPTKSLYSASVFCERIRNEWPMFTFHYGLKKLNTLCMSTALENLIIFQMILQSQTSEPGYDLYNLCITINIRKGYSSHNLGPFPETDGVLQVTMFMHKVTFQTTLTCQVLQLNMLMRPQG